MKYLLIAILLLGACSAQYFNQEEVEASFENDLGDLDAMTKDMDFDEDNFLEDAQDEEDPFDFEDDAEDEFNDENEESPEEPESDLLEAGEADDAELGELEDDEAEPSSYVRISFLTTFFLTLSKYSGGGSEK